MSLLRSEQEPMTKAIRKGIISEQSMEQYRKLIGKKYTLHWSQQLHTRCQLRVRKDK